MNVDSPKAYTISDVDSMPAEMTTPLHLSPLASPQPTGEASCRAEHASSVLRKHEAAASWSVHMRTWALQRPLALHFPTDADVRVRVIHHQQRSRPRHGCVANFAQEVIKRQLPLSVEGMRRPRSSTVRPPCGLRPRPRPPAGLFDPVQAFTTSSRTRRGGTGLAPPPGTGQPVDGSRVWCHAMVAIGALAEGRRGAGRGLVALAGRCLGRAPVQRARLRPPRAAARRASGSAGPRARPGVRRQASERLARLAHGAIEGLPRACALHGRLLQTLPPPPRRLRHWHAAAQGGRSDGPALERGGSPRHPARLPQGCARPRAPGRRPLPAHPHQEDLPGTPDAHGWRLSCSWSRGLLGETRPHIASNENWRQSPQTTASWT